MPVDTKCVGTMPVDTKSVGAMHVGIKSVGTMTLTVYIDQWMSLVMAICLYYIDVISCVISVVDCTVKS